MVVYYFGERSEAIIVALVRAGLKPGGDGDGEGDRCGSAVRLGCGFTSLLWGSMGAYARRDGLLIISAIRELVPEAGNLSNTQRGRF